MSKNRYPDFRVRIPPELKDKIRESAEKGNRSMGADIILRLEQSFAQDDGEGLMMFDNAWLKQNQIEADKLASGLKYLINKVQMEDEDNNQRG